MLRAAVALMLLAGCEVQLPWNQKTQALEQKVALLERQLAAARDANEVAAERRIDLDVCISRADVAYWKYIQLNGRVAKRDEAGVTYRAAPHIWNQASQDKANAIEECKAIWGK